MYGPEARAADIAKHEDVDIRLHSIIYKVEEEIKAAMIGMLDAIEKEVILGKGGRPGNIQGFEDRHDRRLPRYRRFDPPAGKGASYSRRRCDLGRRYRVVKTI